MSRRRAVALTVCVAVLVPGFLALGWWQLSRALSGNTLSWAYTFEWPLFAGYLVWVWWRLLHEDRGAVPESGGEAPDGAGAPGDGPDDEVEDEELAAYNRYLAALEESGRRKHW